jgi:hypothetical protein
VEICTSAISEVSRLDNISEKWNITLPWDEGVPDWQTDVTDALLRPQKNRYDKNVHEACKGKGLRSFGVCWRHSLQRKLSKTETCHFLAFYAGESPVS